MLTVTILTPEKTVFQGDVKSLMAPGIVGYFQILTNHASMISTLQIGKLTVTPLEGEIRRYAISGGVLEVNKNKVTILGDTIEGEAEIDLHRAKEAYDRAFKRLDYPQDKHDFQRASKALLRAKNRIEIKKAHEK